MSEIIDRLTSPTPSFFQKLRNIGLVLAAVATTIATTPIALPALVVKLAGYLAVAAGLTSAVSQTAVKSE